MIEYVWTCRCCGKSYNSLPLAYGVEAPDPWHELPENERRRRGSINQDVCRLDEFIFLRGCLEIPVIGYSEPLVWSVWVSVSERSFAKIGALHGSSQPVDEPPFFGWLMNGLALYPSTYALKANLHLRADMRPLIQLEPTEHPLAIEQRNGIGIERVKEIAAALLHRH